MTTPNCAPPRRHLEPNPLPIATEAKVEPHADDPDHIDVVVRGFRFCFRNMGAGQWRGNPAQVLPEAVGIRFDDAWLAAARRLAGQALAAHIRKAPLRVEAAPIECPECGARLYGDGLEGDATMVFCGPDHAVEFADGRRATIAPGGVVTWSLVEPPRED